MKVYSYDAANRLVGIDYADGSSTEIQYDAFSRRDRIIERDTSLAVVSDKRYIWNALALFEERETATDNALRRFYPEGEKRITGANTGDYFYFRDHLGSVRELVDSSGAIRARYDYGLWGERSKVSDDLDTEFGYTGHWYHGASGLHLAPFRAYDAELGRWINRDPIQNFYLFFPELLPEGSNLFAYVGNNPLIFIDPMGLYGWKSVGGTVLGIAGGVIAVTTAPITGSIIVGVGGALILWDIIDTANSIDCAEENIEKSFEGDGNPDSIFNKSKEFDIYGN